MFLARWDRRGIRGKTLERPNTANDAHSFPRTAEKSTGACQATLWLVINFIRNSSLHIVFYVSSYPPWKGDIVFGLSVWLSVRLSGTLFSHFVRVTPPTVFITHKSNLYHLKAGCLECVMGGQFFRTPQNFGEIGLWKRPKITNSNFWSVTSRRVLGLEMRYPYHMKALLL